MFFVKGLEHSLPSAISVESENTKLFNEKKTLNNKTNTINNSNNLVAYPISNQTCHSSVIIPPSINQQHPWWIPNETDSEVYNSWYESAYKAALQTTSDKDSAGKTKIKYFKRKLEVIDPKTDAGKYYKVFFLILLFKYHHHHHNHDK